MKQTTLRPQAIGLLVGFAVQFIAGMTLNLFVTLPTAHPGTTGSEYFARSAQSLVWALSNSGGLALTIHAYLAVGLFLGCTGLLVRSLALRSRSWAWSAGIAAFFTLGALFNGLSFVDYNENFSSMIMASCWLIAVGALVVGLIRNPQTG